MNALLAFCSSFLVCICIALIALYYTSVHDVPPTQSFTHPAICYHDLNVGLLAIRTSIGAYLFRTESQLWGHYYFETTICYIPSEFLSVCDCTSAFFADTRHTSVLSLAP